MPAFYTAAQRRQGHICLGRVKQAISRIEQIQDLQTLTDR
jgi:hypothetical protein